ncbi:hypothetical protein Q4575_05315 [Psychrosphaera sp. 1_MG-2023]|uniref:hypothetical protein n=1 Tax=Psychrosphaera sp. 1_MG-2023 TaxID=3062643 RepID=UPI0026E2DA78|nr:hypothetical protein [Psychrosphaera sp. 1_MG-2023]MDO6718809.1 hypothetical protein [Psychrosphaera sp. 1_MG-2023]
MRQQSNAMVSLLAQRHSFLHLVKISFPSTDLFLTDDAIDREFNGNTYLSGVLEPPDAFSQNGEPKTNDADFKLSDPDRTIASLILQGGWYNKSVEVRRMYLDASGQIVETIIVWSGTVDSASDESSTVTITASSIWADFDKTSGRKTNIASQKVFYPLDACFKETPNIIKDIPWGRAAPAIGGWGQPSDPAITAPTEEK